MNTDTIHCLNGWCFSQYRQSVEAGMPMNKEPRAQPTNECAGEAEKAFYTQGKIQNLGSGYQYMQTLPTVRADSNRTGLQPRQGSNSHNV